MVGILKICSTGWTFAILESFIIAYRSAISQHHEHLPNAGNHASERCRSLVDCDAFYYSSRGICIRSEISFHDAIFVRDTTHDRIARFYS